MDGLSLKELVALLGMAGVFVGNDSGPMHIAAALGRPIVAVWGSSEASVWHPWSEAPWRIVRLERTHAGKAVDAGVSPGSDIKLISTDAVISAVNEVLELALDGNHNTDDHSGTPKAEAFVVQTRVN